MCSNIRTFAQTRFAREGNIEMSRLTFDTIPSHLSPNVHTFTSLIGAYARVGDVGGAVSLFMPYSNDICFFNIFSDFSELPHSRNYQLILFIPYECKCSIMTDFQVEILNLMNDNGAGVSPNNHTFAALISSHNKSADFKSAEMHIKLMSRYQCRTTVVAYNALLKV